MGKYAANPNCPACRAIGELCLNCAENWKIRQIDSELRLLRRIVRMAHYLVFNPPELDRALRSLEANRKKRPKLKASPKRSVDR